MTSVEVQAYSQGLYLSEPKHLTLKYEVLPAVGVDEVQIAIRSTTICGSDLHYFLHGRNGSIVPRQPLCLGHESSGEVMVVGDRISDLRPGDRVAIELRFRGSGAAYPHLQGMLQERINHPRRWIHQLPSTLSHEDGALLEPLAVALHAVNRASLRPGQTCLVFGAGAVGLLCAAAARYAGCGSIIMADVDAGRLEFAIAHNFADFIHTSKPKRGQSIEDSLAIARDTASKIVVSTASLSSHQKPGCVFECTGAESCLQAAIYATRSGGKVLIVGMGTPNHILPISEASAREIDLIPTWRYSDRYPAAIKMMSLARTGTSSLPDITKLIAHRFVGLDNVTQAFDTAKSTRNQNNKLVIKMALNIFDTVKRT